MSQRPSISPKQQMAYIVENAGILNEETKKSILSIVIMEIGDTVIMDSGPAKEVDINLDKLYELNGDVLNHIYNIVYARRESLNRPVSS